MEYQKIINLLVNTANQLSKFITKNWIEINDQSNGTYNTNSDIRFENATLTPSLGDAYILLKETITITRAGNDAAERKLDERNKGVILKNCTERDNAKNIDIVMPMYNLINIAVIIQKHLGQCYKDEPNDNLAVSESFKSKVKITGNTPNNGNTKDVETIVPLK